LPLTAGASKSSNKAAKKAAKKEEKRSRKPQLVETFSKVFYKLKGIRKMTDARLAEIQNGREEGDRLAGKALKAEHFKIDRIMKAKVMAGLDKDEKKLLAAKYAEECEEYEARKRATEGESSGSSSGRQSIVDAIM
jgi:hypothetical protein